MIDGERKQLLHRSIGGAGLLHFQCGHVGGHAVRSDSDVNHRVVEDKRSKSKLGSQERDHFHLRQHAGGVDQRNIVWTLSAMHGDVPHFDLKVEGDNMETPDFGAPARDPFDFLHHAAAYVSLKRFCGGIPECRQHSDEEGCRCDQDVFPPAARSGGPFAHRVCTP